MKRFLMLLAAASFLALMCAGASAQVPVLYYDFESNAARGTFENSVEQSVNGGGGPLTRSANGAINGRDGAGSFNGGASTGQAISTSGWENNASDPGTAAADYFQFAVNTTGFSQISVTFDNQASPSGPAAVGLMYSTDGTSFTAVAPVATGNNAFGTATFDLSGVPALDNQPSLTIRIYAYAGDRTGRSGFTAQGTFRIDNLAVRARTATASNTLLDYPSVGSSIRSGAAFIPTYTDFVVNGSGITVTLNGELRLSGALTVASGAFDQGAASGLTAGAVSIAGGGTLRNLGSGDLTLGPDGVSNAGTVNFNGSGTPCGGADDIVIRSTSEGAQRTWSGPGVFSLTDVDVRDQRVPGTPDPPLFITAVSSRDSGNNTGWTFTADSSCASGYYTWVGGLGADWQNPASWSPARLTKNTADVLTFDGAVTPGPTVTNFITETIATLRAVNNVDLKLRASALGSPQTLTLSGGPGQALLVEAGSQLTLQGVSPLRINVASGSSGTVFGRMSFEGDGAGGTGAHRLIGNAPSAVTFQSGAFFGTASDFAGNPFGTGSAGDGAAGSIVFADGSDYFHNGGESPFGGAANGAVAIFQTGSTATWLTPSGFQASGRAYANLVVGAPDPGGVAVSVSDTGSGDFQFDSLTVRSTGGANSSLTFTGEDLSTVRVRGDIRSTGAGGSALPDVTLAGGAGGIVIDKPGGGTVNFGTTDNARAVDFEGSATVASGTTLALGRVLLAGQATPNSFVVSVEGALTGSATGYVVGKLRKYLSGTGASTFEVGTPNGYSPVTLAVTSNTNASPAPFTVSAANSYMTGIDVQSKAVKRTYTLTNGGAAGSLTADITFRYVGGSTAAGGDVSNDVNVNTLDAYRRDAVGNIVKFSASSRGANSVTVSGVNSFSDWALANSGAATTLARLQSFRATAYAGGAVLEWRTAYELDNLGFNLYRQSGGRLVRVNPSLVAGSALLAGPGTPLTAGNSYTWPDAAGQPGVRYWLEEIDTDGRSAMRGPFTAAAGRGAAPATHRALLASQIGAARSLRAESGQREFVAPAPVAEASGVEDAKAARGVSIADLPRRGGALERQRELASGPAVKLLVKGRGWYRVTREQLLAAGLRAAADLYDLHLYVEGVEVPLYVSRPDASAPSGAVEFYGTGLDTTSTDARVYWLVESRGGRRRPILPRLVGESAAPVAGGKDASAAEASAGEAAAAEAAANDAAVDAADETAAGEASDGAAARAQKSETMRLGAQRWETPQSDAPESETDAPGKLFLRSRARTAPGARPSPKSGALPSFKSGAQPSSRPGAAPAAEGPESYAYTVERRDRTVYFASVLNGDEENFFGRYVGAAPETQILTARNVSRPGVTGGTLEVSLQGLTTGSHHVRVVFNGTELGSVNFAGRARHAASFEVGAWLLREGDNEVQLTSSGNSDASFTDYLRLTYRHSYRADEGHLRFPAPGAAPLRVTGFDTPNVRVVDVTNPDDATQVVARVEPDPEGGWALVVPAAGHERTLYAFADARVAQVARAFSNSPARLTGGTDGADFVIITNGDFRSQVEPLAAKRAAEGLAVSVVDVEDLYDEFAYGAHSPQAVRDFLAWAASNWTRAPRYVLLVGDGSYDPRGRLGQGASDLMPAKLVDAGTVETASDDWFADFDGDGTADLAVGRLPVRTRAEAEAVVRKIVGHEPGSAQPGALLVADRTGADGYNFEAATTQLAALLPAGVSASRVNRGAQDAAAVRSQVVAGINAGPLVVNWMGHGSTDVWTGEAILSSADAPALTNGARLPLFVLMTCLNGYYVGPAQESLAESLLKAEGGGALAVWASSGLTEPGGQSEANRELFRALFAEPGVRLGDAVRRAKAATPDRDVRRTWVLFGDPSVRLR